VEGQQELDDIGQGLRAVLEALGRETTPRIAPEQGIRHVEPGAGRPRQAAGELAIRVIGRVEAQRH
jgi:hypothetical protein